MRIRSAGEVFATMRQNKLRTFPGRVKGKERLRPFAKPEVLAGKSLPPQPICYMMGTCLARTIDKSLNFAGLTNFAAHNGLPRQHAAFSAPTAFHKVSLPSIENELRWAADPAQDGGISSLTAFKGEFVDLQISAQFAHPETKAQQLRRDYNASFAKAFDADLIFVTIGVTENWFDTKTRLYINGLPPPNLEKEEPGRFELHDWQVEDVRACLGRISDLLQSHTRRQVPPRLAVCVSPVGIGFGHGAEDQLIADVESKAIMRVAAGEFAREDDNADYAPIYEFAILSDRSTVYETGLIDHLNFACIDRFLGEYLSKRGVNPQIADRLTCRGLANTHMSVKQYDEAADLLEKFTQSYGHTEALASLHARALQSAGRREAALAAYIRHAEIGGKGAANSAGAALNLALGKRDLITARRIVDLATASENPELRQRSDDWQAKIAQAQQLAANQSMLKQRVATLLERLLSAPEAVVAELAPNFGNPAVSHQITWIYAQALMKTGNKLAPVVLHHLTAESQTYGKQAGNKLLNLLRKAGGSIGEMTEDEVRKLIVSRQMAQDGGR